MAFSIVNRWLVAVINNAYERASMFAPLLWSQPRVLCKRNHIIFIDVYTRRTYPRSRRFRVANRLITNCDHPDLKRLKGQIEVERP